MPSDLPPVVRWLKGILHNIGSAQSFVGELDRAAFCADTLRVYGVTRCLEIISEASRRMPEALKARHASIAWKEMAGAGSVTGTIMKTLMERRFG